MAVTNRLQKYKPAIVAAICFALIFMVTPLFGLTLEANAQAGESRVIISWERGKAGLESFFNLCDKDPSLKSLCDKAPGLLEKLRQGDWSTPNIQAISLPQGTFLNTAKAVISRLPGVSYVEEDQVASTEEVSNDPHLSQQWYLQQIGAVEAWEVGVGSPEVTVAVVDTGVDAAHPDLIGRVLAGYDFVDGDGTPCDGTGHGTHVAGIIAAAGDNGAGVAGLAWRVQILPVRVLDDTGSGFYSDVIAGIRYAADNSADIINLSLGGGATSRALQEAVDYARSRGVLVVAAAGNDGLDSLSYPAACAGVIGVGACDENDRMAGFSNRGEELDLIAPGVSIYSDYPGGQYAYMSGTSMAAPQVSGALALLLSREPGLSPQEAESRITSTALDVGASGRDTMSGWGRLQVDKALGLEAADPGETDTGEGDLYFAEGYTGPGFDTYLLLENPDSQPSTVALELFGNGGSLGSHQVNVAPRSRLTLRLNDMVPPGDVAVKLILPEGSPLRAQRSMYFNYNGIGGGHTAGASGASQQWYFAEGYTGPGFDTYLLVFNPQASAAHINLNLMTPTGGIEYGMEVAPLSRSTLKVNDVLPGVEMATAISSDIPVVAERAMYFDYKGRQGGSVVMGAAAISEDWYFAEGYTGGEFDEWLLLANPSDTEVTAIASFQRSDGMTVERKLDLQPRSRATLHVDEVTGLEDAEISACIKAAFPGVVAERAMYFSYTGSMGTVGGGHAAMGTTAPSSHWLVPEGYTGSGFESWILVSNLEEEAVTVRLDVLGESGRVVSEVYVVAPHSRFTVKENDLLAGEGVSAEISAQEGALLVVEGAFYFHYRQGIEGGST